MALLYAAAATALHEARRLTSPQRCAPVTPFYFLHVVLSCLILSRRAALGFTLLAYLLIVAQTMLELWGLAPAPVFRFTAYATPWAVVG